MSVKPPINVPTTGQRGVGSTEAEPFGKDEGIDLSEETGRKMNLLFYQSIYPSIDFSGYLSIYLSIYLAIYLFNQSINNPSNLHE